MFAIGNMNMAFAGEPKVIIRNGAFIDNLRQGHLFEKIPAALDIVVDETWGRIAAIIWEPRLRLPYYGLYQEPQAGSQLPGYSDVWSYYGEDYLIYNNHDEVGYEQTDDDMELGIVVGMRFSFKQFDFNSFRKCMRDRLERREAGKGMPSLVFYFDIP